MKKLITLLLISFIFISGYGQPVKSKSLLMAGFTGGNTERKFQVYNGNTWTRFGRHTYFISSETGYGKFVNKSLLISGSISIKGVFTGTESVNTQTLDGSGVSIIPAVFFQKFSPIGQKKKWYYTPSAIAAFEFGHLSLSNVNTNTSVSSHKIREASVRLRPVSFAYSLSERVLLNMGIAEYSIATNKETHEEMTSGLGKTNKLSNTAAALSWPAFVSVYVLFR